LKHDVFTDFTLVMC